MKTNILLLLLIVFCLTNIMCKKENVKPKEQCWVCDHMFYKQVMWKDSTGYILNQDFEIERDTIQMIFCGTENNLNIKKQEIQQTVYEYSGFSNLYYVTYYRNFICY